MADTEKEEDPRYMWMDVGHISGNLPEGVVPQNGMVAVNPDTGTVLPEQPDYPEQPEEPAPTGGEEAPPPPSTSKSSSKSS